MARLLVKPLDFKFCRAVVIEVDHPSMHRINVRIDPETLELLD